MSLNYVFILNIQKKSEEYIHPPCSTLQIEMSWKLYQELHASIFTSYSFFNAEEKSCRSCFSLEKKIFREKNKTDFMQKVVTELLTVAMHLTLTQELPGSQFSSKSNHSFCMTSVFHKLLRFLLITLQEIFKSLLLKIYQTTENCHWHI